MFEKTSDAMSFLHQHGIFFVTEKDVDIEIYAKTIDYLENANLQLGFKLPNLPYVPRLGASYTGGNSVIEPISLRDHISAGSKKLIPLNSKCQNIQLVLNFEGKKLCSIEGEGKYDSYEKIHIPESSRPYNYYNFQDVIVM